VKRKRLLITVSGCIVAVILGVLLWPREREPEYKGVPLSTWLDRWSLGGQVKFTEAQEAIRQMGTNVLPTLTRWIQFEQPGWRVKLSQLSSKLPSFLTDNRTVQLLIVGKAEYHAAMAEFWFYALGSDAQPAVAELQRLANNAGKPETQARAMRCLKLMEAAGIRRAAQNRASQSTQ
jgi:hypothetical protein